MYGESYSSKNIQLHLVLYTEYLNTWQHTSARTNFSTSLVVWLDGIEQNILLVKIDLLGVDHKMLFCTLQKLSLFTSSDGIPYNLSLSRQNSCFIRHMRPSCKGKFFQKTFNFCWIRTLRKARLFYMNKLQVRKCTTSHILIGFEKAILISFGRQKLLEFELVYAHLYKTNRKEWHFTSIA